MNKILITPDLLKAQAFLKANLFGLALVYLTPLFDGTFICLNSGWLKTAMESLSGCQIISQLNGRDSVRIWGERLSHPAELYFPETLKPVLEKLITVLPDMAIVVETLTLSNGTVVDYTPQQK
jgi:hypothetical protein